MDGTTDNGNVVVTRGTFQSDDGQSLVTVQPKSPSSHTDSIREPVIPKIPFDDAHCERAWSSPLCMCTDEKRHWCCSFWCWPYFRYNLAMRLGETPFMPLIPCGAFALRVKVRTLFGIKGSILEDFATTLCCEPCTICQMTRELDHIGL
ncbi:hypothetical protein ACJMK2_007118 [Sinanodonta woodiana]|uniref:Cornifelin n=1 Tax=Sinanodonta woodiana TaxID=1069815 RepID=A0ABD3VHL4_SINWO